MALKSLKSIFSTEGGLGYSQGSLRLSVVWDREKFEKFELDDSLSLRYNLVRDRG